MIDISVKNLVKSFEIGSNILDGLTFSISSGEHVGILGNNGCGKTTLLRILTGEIDYDEGDIALAQGKKIGLISQIPVFPKGWSCEDVLNSAFMSLNKISDRINEIEQLLAAGNDSMSLLNEYGELTERFEREGGYDCARNLSKVASGLDIDADMLKREFESLSGGEKTRVNLGRLILEDTDILFLDEPTNHLDMHAIQWLEEYIDTFKGTVLSISHDRYFLDKVCQRCIDISSGKAELYSGNYSFYVEEKSRRAKEQLKQYEKEQAKIEQLQKAVDQMHLWAFMGNDKLHKRAFSMEKRIEKMNSTAKPKAEKKLSVKFKQADFSGDEVLVLDGVSMGYEKEKVLFEGFDALIIGGEKIALIGDNGTGKSSLLKVIMNELHPLSGYIYKGPTVKTAYLPQLVQFNVDERSSLDTMLYECGCSPQEARDRLAAFGFRGEKVFTPVCALSGGEKSRLRLCMLMGSDINFLILDEPTNHLDILSREWMEDALADYGETLLFVSHDRYFTEKFATRIWAVHDGKIHDFRGGYGEYTEYLKRMSDIEQAKRNEVRAAIKKEPVISRPVKKNSEKDIKRIEKEISTLEGKISVLDAECEKFSADYIKLIELDEEKNKIQEQLDLLYDKWAELSE